MKSLVFAAVVAVCSFVHAEKSIEQTVRRADGSVFKRVITRPDDYVVGSGVTRRLQSVVALGPREVNRGGARAYEWAKREATILARQGRVYHPLGCAPGTTMSGCGSSFSENQPNHCYIHLPEHRIVARACVRGNDGRFYWSCHYR